MNFVKDKTFNLKNNHFLIDIFLIILIFILISSVSASNLSDIEISDSNIIIEENNVLMSDNEIKTDNQMESEDNFEYEDNVLSTNSVHKISSSSTNDEIQTIFDNSKSGDTIEFDGGEYNNVSIVVNKRLNIVSIGNSIIHTSDSICPKASEMGVTNSFGFYLGNLASGSLIKGFRFIGNSDYGILVEGGNEITIINNNITGAKKGGILLNNSKSNIIKNNTVTKSYNGIVLEGVNRTAISFNRIHSNKNMGLVLEKVFNNNITNNSIYKNGLDGVLLKDAKSNRVIGNNISNNGVCGLRLEGSTTRNIIMHNNISSNVVNVYANSLTNGDQISHNTLMFAKKVFGTYIEDDNVGAAIVFADNYEAAKQGNMLFSHNSIGMNDVWDAKSTMSHPPVNIGPNWYFDNDGNYAIGHICPMVFGKAITVDDLKTLSLGFSSDGKGIFGQLYDGDLPSGAGAFNIDNVIVNGKDYGSVEVGEDGRFNLDLSNLPAGSVVTINVSGHVFNITIDEEIASGTADENSQPIEPTNNTEPTQKSNEKTGEKPIRESFTNPTTGNGTGSGSGFSTGSGSGEGNFSGSGISVGVVSGHSNAGTGDSGENGGGSASDGANAYEILKEENIPATAKNSQIIAIFGVALVILIVALGYRSKNKDDYQFENENFEL